MPRTYDLNKLSALLTEQQARARKTIQRVVGATVIINDLGEAAQLFELGARWHTEQVIPNRTDFFDKGDVANIGRALFISAMVALCRALDDASKGRSHIDLKADFKAAGISDSHAVIDEFRRKELAHFDNYKLSGRPYSDDRAVLIREDNGNVHLNALWYRTHTSGELARHAIQVADCAIAAVRRELDIRREQLLQLIVADQNLRRFIDQHADALDVKPPAYFARMGVSSPSLPEFVKMAPELTCSW